MGNYLQTVLLLRCIAFRPYDIHFLTDGLLVDINVLQRIHHDLKTVQRTSALERFQQRILLLVGKLLGKLRHLIGGEVDTEAAVE